jgi:hypothetical protein
MIRSTLWWRARAVLAVVLGVVTCGCATKGADGSTHFARCKSDAECAPDETCSIDGKCLARLVSTIDAAGAGEASVACTGFDTRIDPENCGACGNVCGPTTLASGATAFAIDATNVYWTDASARSVMKAPLAGGTPTTLASGQSSPGLIAVDATSVYWANQEVMSGVAGVMKVPLAGGSVVTLASGLVGEPYGVVVTGTSVVCWLRRTLAGNYGTDFSAMAIPVNGGTPVTLVAQTTYATPPSAVSGNSFVWVQLKNSFVATCADGGALCNNIMMVPLGGGSRVELVSSTSNIGAVTADAANVYWADSGQCPGVDGGTDGGCGIAAIKTVPLAGGNPVTLASDIPSDSTALTVDPTSVYSVAYDPLGQGEGAIIRVPIAGGSPVTIASRQVGMSTFAFDGTNAYWINAAPSGIVGARAKVMKVPLSGGSPVVLASLVPPPASRFSGMIVDGTSVYWADGSNVMKLPLAGIACQNGACQ